MNRRLPVLVAAVLIAAAGSGIAAVPASAVPASAVVAASHTARTAAGATPIQYSLDGTHWSATPPASVFPTGWRPVPGDSRTETLYLRSNRPGATILGVFAGGASASSTSLLDSTTVRSTGQTVPLSAETSCALLAPQHVVTRGQVIAVPLTIGISPDLDNARGASLRLDLYIDLSDTGAPTLPGGCPVDPAIVHAFPGAGTPGTAPESIPSWLADTGSGFSVVAAAVAAIALLLGIGIAFTRRPRSRR